MGDATRFRCNTTPIQKSKNDTHFQTITSPQHPGIAQTWKTFGELWG